MTDLIRRELWEVLMMFSSGISIGLLFSTRDMCILRVRKAKRVKIFIYLLSWPLAGFLFSKFLYEGGKGALSWQGIVATCLGIMLWKYVICGIIYQTIGTNKYGNGEQYGTGEDKKEEENKLF